MDRSSTAGEDICAQLADPAQSLQVGTWIELMLLFHKTLGTPLMNSSTQAADYPKPFPAVVTKGGNSKTSHTWGITLYTRTGGGKLNTSTLYTYSQEYFILPD